MFGSSRVCIMRDGWFRLAGLIESVLSSWIGGIEWRLKLTLILILINHRQHRHRQNRVNVKKPLQRWEEYRVRPPQAIQARATKQQQRLLRRYHGPNQKQTTIPLHHQWKQETRTWIPQEQEQECKSHARQPSTFPPAACLTGTTTYGVHMLLRTVPLHYHLGNTVVLRSILPATRPTAPSESRQQYPAKPKTKSRTEIEIRLQPVQHLNKSATS